MQSVIDENTTFIKARTKWTMIFVIVVVSLVSVIAGLIYIMTSTVDLSKIDLKLKNTPDLFEQKLQKLPQATVDELLGKIDGVRTLPFVFIEEGWFLEIRDMKGNTLLYFGDPVDLPDDIIQGFNNYVFESETSQEEMVYRIFSREIKAPFLNRTIYMISGRNLKEFIDERFMARMYIFISITLALICSWIFGRFLSSIVLKPIRQSYEKLQRFSMDASHELKTPITIMKTSMDIIKSKYELEPDLSRKISLMDRTLNRMDKLVRQLLLLAKNGSERLPDFRQEEFDPGLMCEEICEEYHSLYSDKSIEVNLIYDEPFTVRTNREILSIITGNLLENAIKFSPKNSKINIIVAKAHKKTCISVQDFGTGMDSDEVKNIFERFYKNNSNVEGSGLGLSIVREMLGAINAEISVDSEKGKGSIFTVSINRK